MTRTSAWVAHGRATLLLGLPLIGAQLAQTALNVTNTLIVGRLGAAELAAAALGWQFFYIVWMLGSGFGFAVMPLVANAVGAREPGGVRRYVRMGLWASALYGLAMMVPLWHAEAIFVALGQDARIAALAGDYLRLLQWSLFPQLAVIVLRSFLGALDRPGIVVPVLVLGGVLNGMLGVWLVFGGLGVPALGMQGAGLATVLATTLVALVLLAYAVRERSLRGHAILTGFLRADRPALAEVSRLGWPIGVTVVAEVGLFTATSILMGWVGPLELAAHGIALQLSSLAFMIPLGLSSAATIRVGWAYGRGDRRGVAQAAGSALAIGVGIACLSALVFLTMPEALIGLYLDLDQPASAAVLPHAVGFLAVAAAFQIVDAVQGLSSGSLRGLKDARLPMVMAVASYWGVGLPAAWWLAFRADLGGLGIWWGLALGLAAAAASMTLRLVWKIRFGPTMLASDRWPTPGR